MKLISFMTFLKQFLFTIFNSKKYIHLIISFLSLVPRRPQGITARIPEPRRVRLYLPLLSICRAVAVLKHLPGCFRLPHFPASPQSGTIQDIYLSQEGFQPSQALPLLCTLARTLLSQRSCCKTNAYFLPLNFRPLKGTKRV